VKKKKKISTNDENEEKCPEEPESEPEPREGEETDDDKVIEEDEEIVEIESLPLEKKNNSTLSSVQNVSEKKNIDFNQDNYDLVLRENGKEIEFLHEPDSDSSIEFVSETHSPARAKKEPTRKIQRISDYAYPTRSVIREISEEQRSAGGNTKNRNTKFPPEPKTPSNLRSRKKRKIVEEDASYTPPKKKTKLLGDPKDRNKAKRTGGTGAKKQIKRKDS